MKTYQDLQDIYGTELLNEIAVDVVEAVSECKGLYNGEHPAIQKEKSINARLDAIKKRISIVASAYDTRTIADATDAVLDKCMDELQNAWYETRKELFALWERDDFKSAWDDVSLVEFLDD